MTTPAAGAPPREPEPPRPYVAPEQSLAEFTVRALLAGVVAGILFGAANAYLGLRAGLTISTSIPIAVMTVAVFKALRSAGIRTSILEANLSQTVGSASSSVASGVIFTLPALFMWGLSPTLAQMTMLGMLGGLLGVLFMIPLRRFLIVAEHWKLPYPEGTACARVLVASEEGGRRARNVFLGLGAGALLKFLTGWAKVLPARVEAAVPVLPKAQLGMDVSAALFGVGYILGPRIAAVMVGGGLLASLVLIPALALWGAGRVEPLYPETVLALDAMSPREIWSKYIRYIGAGAVATGGFLTLLRSIPTMVRSFRMGAGQLSRRLREGEAGGDGAGTTGTPGTAVPRTARDLPLKVVFLGAGAVVLTLAVVPHAFSALATFPMRLVAALFVAVFAFFFVTVSSRIVGMVGVTSNPTSGMTIAALLGTSMVFLALGWTDMTGKVAALTVGCVVAIAASIAGDTSQDLKTGFLLGATPRFQQMGELLGVLASATFVCMAVLALHRAFGLGSAEIPAPQATLMRVVIDGVLDQSLPWTLVFLGVGLALCAEVLRIPSLPFAVGVYLPVSTMVPVFLGGLLRLWTERSTRGEAARASRREKGILFGSGLVGGEGLLGVAFAAVVLALGRAPAGLGTAWAGALAPLAGLAAFGLLAFCFARLSRAGGGDSAAGAPRRPGPGV